MVRVSIVLACAECKSRNYTISKNKATQSQRIEIRKYCPSCKKYQPHRETR